MEEALPEGESRRKESRNIGIDLLRIVCMLMICVLHVCGQGGAMVKRTGHESTWYSVYVLETAAYCAVNTYGMISGYVGISSKRRPSRLLELWLTVFWYSALGTVLGVFLFGHPLEKDTVYKALLPTMWKTYWYFSGYVGVFVLEPYLNKMVAALSDHGKKKLMLTLFLLFSVFTMVPRASETGADFLGIGAGYSFLWLAVMYVLGACARQLQEFFFQRKISFYVLLYAACVGITWISKILLESWTMSVYGKARYGRLLFSYAGPTVVICAFALLMIFSRLNVRGRRMRGAIRFLTPMTFPVYLVQVQPYFWKYALKSRFGFISLHGPLAACLLVLFWSAALYLFCTGIDLFRMFLFQALHVRKGARKVTDGLLVPLQRLFREAEAGPDKDNSGST